MCIYKDYEHKKNWLYIGHYCLKVPSAYCLHTSPLRSQTLTADSNF